MKERVTLTIDKELLRRIDELVDDVNIKNRSHAVEVLIRRAFERDMPRQAVILVGGKGTRLRPLTLEIPKALIPIHGKTLTEHLFDMFKKYGITEIILSVGYLKDKIIQYFGDGSRFGVKISYIKEESELGTAGPLHMLRGKVNTPIIVSNGDELKDVNLREMYNVHRSNNALATIALTTVQDPSQYGVARLSGSRILEFVEKPKKEDAPSRLINAGLYILNPEVIEMVKEGFSMLERDIFPKIAEMGRLYGYPFSGQWFDTGNIERYERAIKEWNDLS